MRWEYSFIPEARKDLLSMDGSQQKLVYKALNKVQQNPLPVNEGGYGKPLGNKGGINLTGLLKIKLKSSGIRIVYKLVRTQTKMLIIVVGMRSDDEVYLTAKRRTESES